MQKSHTKSSQAKHSSLQVTAFDGLTVEIHPSPEHEFVMSNREVAHAYGISDSALHKHVRRHKAELTEGTHYFLSRTNSPASNLPIKTKMWTRAGVIRLGMFIRSERAVRFRDWAEALILERLEGAVSSPAPERRKGGLPKGHPTAHNRLTPQRMISILTKVAQIEDRGLRLSLLAELTGEGGRHA